MLALRGSVTAICKACAGVDIGRQDRDALFGHDKDAFLDCLNLFQLGQCIKTFCNLPAKDIAI